VRREGCASEGKSGTYERLGPSEALMIMMGNEMMLMGNDERRTARCLRLLTGTCTSTVGLICEA
jgi:hypothetical protein